jgi:hypothetical protein
MSELDEMCDSMVGLSFDISGQDYGRIMRWVKIEKDGYTYNVFITSLGHKVEAVTLIDYIKHTIRYPKETDPNRNKVKVKSRGGGRNAFGSGIRNIAYFRGDTGDIRIGKGARS